MSNVLLLLALVAGAVYANNQVVDQEHRALPVQYCRCEAAFESFYARRRLREGSRQLGSSYPYDYSDSYVDAEGYSIVEGVRVVPADECEALGGSVGSLIRNGNAGTGGGSGNNNVVMGGTSGALANWLNFYGGGRRSLQEEEYHSDDDEEETMEGEEHSLYFDYGTEEEVEEVARNLKGSKSSKGYYYGGGG